MELKIELSQKQVLSQHMVQSMEILQMSAHWKAISKSWHWRIR